MVGCFGDVVISDAIVREIPGFDLSTARSALAKDSFEAPPSYAGNAVGKEGLSEYDRMGYVPVPAGRGGDQVSRTLDFSFADFAVANAFTKLAEMPQFTSDRTSLLQDAKKLQDRSKRAYRSLFSKDHGLMLPKDQDRKSVV